MMELILTLLSGNQSGHMSRVRGERLVVGRATGSKIRIPSSQVSRSHALITWQKAEGGYYLVEDMGSTNGTFINQIAVMNPVAVLPGDDLHFGSIAFRIHYRMEPKALKRLSSMRMESGYPSPGATPRAALAIPVEDSIPLADIIEDAPSTQDFVSELPGVSLFDDAPIRLAGLTGSEHLDMFQEPPAPYQVDEAPLPLLDAPMTLADDLQNDLDDFDLDELGRGLQARNMHLADMAKLLGEDDSPPVDSIKPPPRPKR
ncbi:MAG: FHA domain-containing protein [Gemmataceae bacterium]